jgi:hypothetical protein
MTGEDLSGQLAAFSAWKQQHLSLLQDITAWLEQQGLYTDEARTAIAHSVETLQKDCLNLAVVGEFSRGKTELINSLFFAGYGRRLLPTNAGRTTLCPTEIFQDDSQAPFLRLLPIQTRNMETSLAELRNEPGQWHSIDLDLGNAEALEEQLRELTASLEVTPEEAASLELSTDQRSSEGLVQIPKWRLAQINFRHPLLAEGICILDTPGLNSIGNEPELTYEMLPKAQAVLFVLSADTGVTRSDLDIWHDQLRGPGGRPRPGMMVVLNKIDTLWDELRPHEHISDTIDEQRSEVARLLAIDSEQVFGASAQKALLARIRGDRLLEQRTGILNLERHLASQLVRNRQAFIQEQATNEVLAALLSLQGLVEGRLTRAREQMSHLAKLADQRKSSLDLLYREAKQDRQRYEDSIASFREHRESFVTHGKALQKALSMNALNATIAQARKRMSGAWTTMGLRDGMKVLFDDINNRMEQVAAHTQSMRRNVRTIYRRFETDHGFQITPPPMYSTVKHQVALGLLVQEAELFRRSSRTLLTEQHLVVRRYFNTLVHRARHIFAQANKESLHWLQGALKPITTQMDEHRKQLEANFKDLKTAGHSRKHVKHREAELAAEQQALMGQAEHLAELQAALTGSGLEDPEPDSQLTRSLHRHG